MPTQLNIKGAEVEIEAIQAAPKGRVHKITRELSHNERLIYNTHSLEELQALCFSKIETFNIIDNVKAICRVATLLKVAPNKESEIKKNFQLIDELKNKLKNDFFPKLEPRQISSTSWALATLGVRDLEFLTDLALKAIAEKGGGQPSNRTIFEFSPQELANTALAYATLRVPVPQLFDNIAEAAADKVCNFKEQEIVNTAFAFAIHLSDSGRECSTPIRAFYSEKLPKALRELQNYTFDPKSLAQLHLVSLFCQDAHIKLYYPEKIKSQISDHLSNECSATYPSSSPFHKKIAEELKTVKPDFQEEHFIEGYFIDIAYPEEKIAIEINGPSHYIHDTEMVFGNEILRRHLLRARGWTVLTVPYFDLSHIEKIKKKLIR